MTRDAKDGRVLYLTEAKNENHYFNIPIANTTVILLGTGTSISQAAMRMLATAGVPVGFCGGGAGTPLFMGAEIEWLTPQNEYRPTEYMQGWMQFWFDEHQRVAAAKQFQQARIDFIRTICAKDRHLKEYHFYLDDTDIKQAITGFEKKVSQLNNAAGLCIHGFDEQPLSTAGQIISKLTYFSFGIIKFLCPFSIKLM